MSFYFLPALTYHLPIDEGHHLYPTMTYLVDVMRRRARMFTKRKH